MIKIKISYERPEELQKVLEKQPESFVKSMVFLNISPYYGIIDIANKTLIVPHRKMCVPVYSPNCGSL